MPGFYANEQKNGCDNMGNQTSIVFQNLYEGIPDTLLLNIISTIILIVFFTIIRKEINLIRRDKARKRWTQMFYSTFTKLSDLVALRTKIFSKFPSVNLGRFNWMVDTIKLNRDSILRNCGPDALFYLSFQQHLLFVMGGMTCVSICIALPINFQGNVYKNTKEFGRTTLSNLPPESEWLWIHVIISILYIPLVHVTMQKSNVPKIFRIHSRTILIRNISPKDRDKTIIKNYIENLFPKVEIEYVGLAYDIAKLALKYEEYDKVTLALSYIHNIAQVNSNKKIYVRPNFWSCNKIDAFEYYTQEDSKLAKEVAELRKLSLKDPMGIAFVTMSNGADARNITSHFRSGTYKNWKISLAPTSSDINWENLNASPNKWYLKWYFVNICLFLILFFMTTPAIILNALNYLILSKNRQTIEQFSPIVSHFLPTIILMILKVTMPILVEISENFMFHWTKSLEQLAIMTKTFGFLIFMTLILPSLGLTSVSAFLEWTVSNAIKETNEYRWKCVFLPNKGAFFLNYVITSAFIGNVLDLIRFPDLVLYGWKKIISKSVAETPYIRKTIFVEFPFGVHYAWIILIFTICAVYSLICPLITPFGILYILIKYFCDKHNLYFIYGPTNMIEKSAERIHKTAVSLTNFSVVMVMIIMSAFITMRAQGFDAKSLVLIVTIFITLLLLILKTIISNFRQKRRSFQGRIVPSAPYIPKVLYN